MRRIRLIAPLAALIAALALPAFSGASADDVLRDCSDDGKFSKNYSYQELKVAESKLPNDLREYTDCEALIRAALAKGPGGSPAGGIPLGGGGTGNGGTGGGINGAVETGSGAAGSPGDVAALAEETARARRGKPSIIAAGKPISPASSGLNHVASAANELPPELLVAILGLIVLCAAAGATATWRRWPALVRAPIRFLRD